MKKFLQKKAVIGCLLLFATIAAVIAITATTLIITKKQAKKPPTLTQLYDVDCLGSFGTITVMKDVTVPSLPFWVRQTKIIASNGQIIYMVGNCFFSEKRRDAESKTDKTE